MEEAEAFRDNDRVRELYREKITNCSKQIELLEREKAGHEAKLAQSVLSDDQIERRLEAIREIVGFGEGLVGRLLMLDARSLRFEMLRYAWDPANPLSGRTPTIRDLSIHAGAPQGAVCAA